MKVTMEQIHGMMDEMVLLQYSEIEEFEGFLVICPITEYLCHIEDLRYSHDYDQKVHHSVFQEVHNNTPIIEGDIDYVR